jgi:uncharacterized membrane protein
MDINPPVTPAKPSSPYAENFKHMLGSMHVQFPKFKREHHPEIVNVNEVADERLTLGQRIADKVASNMGSWRFIIIQASIMMVWVFLNVVGWIYRFDPYPFILLNLAMSAQAAFATPLIMMSQNRQAQKDRLTAENDYKTDVKGEEEICHIMDHLDHQDALILQVVQHIEGQNQHLDHLDTLTLQIVQRLEEQNQRLAAQHQEILNWLSKRDPQIAAELVNKIDQAQDQKDTK